MDQQHILDVAQGSFTLLRRPFHERSTLRAWDAADEYLLDHIDEQGLVPAADWLVVNDVFGALACALSAGGIAWHSDSVVSTLGTNDNLSRNDLPACDPLPWPLGDALLGDLSRPPRTLARVILKVPKTLSLLEDQLHRIRPFLGTGSEVLAAGMTKHVHTSTLKLFENIIGTTTTSLARKKARLIFASVDPELTPQPSPHPMSYVTDTGIATVNHAGIFSQTKLDIGTRFLLEQLPTLSLDRPGRIVDLACGNGILGVAAAIRFPSAELVFTDESAAAIASARATWQANLAEREPEPTFLHTDVLDGVDDHAADLVLLNPPFHEQHAVSEAGTTRMFAEAKRALRTDGQLVVVANRHLGYHQRLRRMFSSSHTVAGNKKFVILQATA